MVEVMMTSFFLLCLLIQLLGKRYSQVVLWRIFAPPVIYPVAKESGHGCYAKFKISLNIWTHFRLKRSKLKSELVPVGLVSLLLRNSATVAMVLIAFIHSETSFRSCICSTVVCHFSLEIYLLAAFFSFTKTLVW